MTNHPTDDSQEAPGMESPGQSGQTAPEPGLPKIAHSGFEWRTRIGLFGIPLICVSYGRDLQGRIRVAKGFLAIGQIAIGGIAIGGFAAGIMSIGLLSIGALAAGVWALGLLLAVGQMACGLIAIGQVVVGLYGLGQIGWAKYMWSEARTDMEAVAMFYTIKMTLLQEGGIKLREVVVGGADWGRSWLLSIFK